MSNRNSERETGGGWIFAAGALIGAVCFLSVYGVRVLDFTYTDWLFFGEQDLYQHYIGWCHYRTTPWQFPLGMIDSLAAPLKVSVVWTDSIPLFAVIFKLFRDFLPAAFQYFGLFGLLSFMLQGGLAALILRRITGSSLAGLAGAPFFVLSFPMLQRMFYHTSLGAQWIILLSVWIWLEKRRFRSVSGLCAAWAGVAFLTVFIHSYFLPVTALMMAGMTIDLFWKGREWKKGLLTAVSYFGSALLSLWSLGAFADRASAVGEGLGTFSSNLNTFYNSQGHGLFFRALPLYFDWQSEGYGYLGAGGLLLLLAAAVALACRIGRLKKEGAVFDRAFVKEALRRRPPAVLLFCAALILFLYAVSPIVTFNGVELVHVPLPGFVEKLLNIFRSSGRFIWTPLYLLTAGSVYVLFKYWNKRAAAGLLVAALLVQLLDLSPYAVEKRDYFAGTRWNYEVMWEGTPVDDTEDIYNAFLFMYTDNDILLPTAYYAYFHGMSVNNYYFARSYEEYVGQQIEAYRSELLEGRPRKDAVYVFRDREGLKDYPLHYREMYGHIVGTAEPLPD